MTFIEKINFAGLLLSFIGGCMLFRWGPPQPSLEPGSFLLLEGPEVDAEDERVRKLRLVHLRLSKLALGLIVFGFFLQLGAVKPVCAVIGWGCPS